MAATQKPLSFSLCPENIEYVLAVVAKQKLTNRRYNRSTYMDDLITHLRTKAKPAKKAKTELAAVTYPIKLNIEAWDKWIAFRKVAKFKAYKSDATMKKLSEMGNHGEQMLIVQNSIDCEYQGLFALKANNSAATKTSGNLSACEDFING
jgi:Holliday junction resolvase RusA-like endonuclease